MGISMKIEFKEDVVYRVVFYDHCMNDDDSITCEVFGRVIRQDDNVVVLSWWNILNSNVETRDNNREQVTIVKSTIKSKRVIHRSLL